MTLLWYYKDANKQTRGVLFLTATDYSNMVKLEGKAPFSTGFASRCLLAQVASFRRGRRFVMYQQLELIKRLPELPEGFGYWFAGLTDGEGHLGVQIKTRKVVKRGITYITQECGVHFAIALRSDDVSVLSYIKETLKCGTLLPKRYKNPPPYDDPIMTWKVMRSAELKYIIVPLFETYPLRTKKAIEFELWKEVVDMRYASIQRRLVKGRPRAGHFLRSFEWERAKEIQKQIRELRRYAKRRNEWKRLSEA